MLHATPPVTTQQLFASLHSSLSHGVSVSFSIFCRFCLAVSRKRISSCWGQSSLEVCGAFLVIGLSIGNAVALLRLA
ncbi:hypothetical protein B0H63DRAFT_476889 [Podospora didyma]|uniref:Uncharacterized protein n=1 Tax=Podospora didyma TaxID=330526 RepID=A0AAE0TWB4_9PEZI|nr:hypothetical protein B0H63DRAFT_476889 [Podospora didyma]